MNLFTSIVNMARPTTQPTAPLFPRDMSAEHVRERAKGFGLYGEARVVDEHVRKVAPWVEVGK